MIVEPKERVDAEFWERGEVDGTFSCGLAAWAYVRVYLGVLVQMATQHFKCRIYMEYESFSWTFLELISKGTPPSLIRDCLFTLRTRYILDSNSSQKCFTSQLLKIHVICWNMGATKGPLLWHMFVWPHPFLTNCCWYPLQLSFQSAGWLMIIN